MKYLIHMHAVVIMIHCRMTHHSRLLTLLDVAKIQGHQQRSLHSRYKASTCIIMITNPMGCQARIYHYGVQNLLVFLFPF